MGAEEWSPIPAWEKFYEVSNLGQVKSLRSGRLLTASSHPSGHKVVTLRDAPRAENRYIHRLVAESFIPNPECHPLVRHLNDNPGDNHVSNLAWGDYKDNKQDYLRNNPPGQKTHCVNGHEYDDKNTRLYKGVKYCRACGRDFARRKREAEVRSRLKATGR